MSCHSPTTSLPSSKQQILLLGNANAGKSSLFNALTGQNQKVGNWPGVTVDRKEGTFHHESSSFNMVDLPGVMSLSSPESERLDERITRQALLSSKNDILLIVLDPTLLERSLTLVLQALDYGMPVVAAMTKADLWPKGVAQSAAKALSQALKIPVIALSTKTENGVAELKNTLISRELCAVSSLALEDDLQSSVDKLTCMIAQQGKWSTARSQALAHRLLEEDDLSGQMMDGATRSYAKQVAQDYEELSGLPLSLMLVDAQSTRALDLVESAQLPDPQALRGPSDKIDRIILSRYLGVPVFLGVMYLMFFIAINVSSGLIELFDGLGAALFVETPTLLLMGTPFNHELLLMLTSAFGGGLQTLVTFIPVVGLLFLCQTFLEQSGYMARVAVVTDRLMRRLGLSGRAFLPMILGFGCSVPAIVSTRALETQRERVVASMMTPFMSCGARLPVYALFAAAFFPENGQNVVFLLYFLGVLAAIGTGLVISRSYYAGAASPLAIELPTYQFPPLKQWLKVTWSRLKLFIIGAGKIIIIVVGVLAILNSIDLEGNVGNESNGRSVLAVVSQKVTPVLSPMGIEQDNWPATVGLITGIFAKEALVGTLQELYSEPAHEDEVPAPLETISGALEAFQGELMGLAAAALDPLGIDVGDISSLETAAEEQDVEVSLFTSLQKHFDGKVGAFAYMIAVLLYLPCSAALAAIWREVGRNWALFAAFWTTVLAYSCSVMAYQLGTFTRHPQTSVLWIAAALGLLASIILIMRHMASRPTPSLAQTEVRTA
ncbi:ferrous iron transport protein B [Flexibacterium corallicola]|uniref:ferrous iron transport protein B n=1 Tax=Flexibacterium corallicola TaxID=3037259 RepID=UPI00286F21C0|nr:ferrous iron transport protein B [Pseudovibrio sp. M1P-2-3]